MKKTQKTAFLDGEGDRWFERNEHALAQEKDVVTDAIGAMRRSFSSICEIGCADGHRLAALTAEYNADGAGIDPSSQGIESGLKTYPSLNLKIGTADTLPFANHSFDLVIIGFCFYLVDPKDHFKAVAEADRVLQDKGALVIFDFLSAVPYYNEYMHLKGIKAHKMDVQRYFTASPAYHLVHRQLDRSDEKFLQLDRRSSVDILLKNMDTAFPANPFV